VICSIVTLFRSIYSPVSGCAYKDGNDDNNEGGSENTRGFVRSIRSNRAQNKGLAAFWLFGTRFYRLINCSTS
jgi:hypothetical protein